MHRRILVCLFVPIIVVAQDTSTRPRPASVVSALYRQVVALKPLGIPKGPDKAAIYPFLSKGLTRTLETAQRCEDDYFRRHHGENEKPAFYWLESGLFSGENEQAIPVAAKVRRSERQKDGSFHVVVQLAYKESFETYGRSPDPTEFHWDVVAVVAAENERFVVDDILLLDDDSKKVESRLTTSFTQCNGPHWVGDKN